MLFALVSAAGSSPAWASWVTQTSGTTNNLTDVHFPLDATTGYAVGWSGTILKTTDGGASWVAQTSPISNRLTSVHFPVDATTGYAVGHVGKILKTINGGASWVEQTSGTTNNLRSVDFPVDATTGYAVGFSGTILTTTNGGASWIAQTSGTANNLTGVHFPVDATTGYTVGYLGTILTTTNSGASWIAQTSGTTARLTGVHFPVDATTGYVVGNAGTILTTTNSGTNWIAQTSGTTSILRGVHFPVDATTGYVVGFSGTILRTVDSGANWIAQSSPISTTLHGIHFPVDATTGYAVGDNGAILKLELSCPPIGGDILYLACFDDQIVDQIPAGWTVSPGAGGVVVEVDGPTHVLTDGTTGGAPVTSGDPGWVNVSVSQRFRSINGVIDHAGVIARYVDDSNMVYGGIVTATTAQIWNRIGGTWTQLGSTWTIPDVSTGWHTQELRVGGVWASLYIDDIFVGSAAVMGGAPPAGKTGFWSQYGANEGYRDDHLVRALGATAVSLVSFEARARDAAVELSWQTGSELDNLGFHLYRAFSEDGPWEQLTSTAIPGLGSSPVGANYSYHDSGLTNGVTYYYQLQDIETTGRTELHGPVSAAPEASASSIDEEPGSSGSAPAEDSNTSLITYGDPSANSLRVLKRARRHVVLELVTEGFYAKPQEDGSVRLEVPGFESLSEVTGPGVPVKRAWVEAVAGRKVKLVSIRPRDVEAFTSLRPSDAEVSEIVAASDGTVRAAQRPKNLRRTARRAFRGDGLSPLSAARIVSVGFQGEVKKALVELAPLRWDESRGQLLLARRLVVHLSLREREPTERVLAGGVRGRRDASSRSRDQRSVVARLVTTESGLHSVRYEEVMQARRGVAAKTLRLSRQGEPVAYHLRPNRNRFKPGSVLYFVSEGAQANPFGDEAVYELELSRHAEAMESVSAAPSGPPQAVYWHRAEWEQDRYYQSALVDAPDLWLWDLLFAPEAKSYPIEVSALAPSASEASKLSVWLQGASDFPANPDHHVRVVVNGTLVEELSWDGKQAKRLDIELAPGLLREGDNVLELDNVGDTEAAYSMVMLDRYAVEYPRLARAEGGRLQGRWSASGTAELSGFVPETHVLDMSEAQPRWLVGTQVGADGLLRFHAESGRNYLAVSPEALHHPVVTKPRASRLRNTRNRADYLLIGPQSFLEAARPLLELRQTEGLKVQAVSIEEVYSEFGFGERTPEAVKEFLSYAYHNWKQPSPRYVLLLGDATYDFKDYMLTGVKNHVPPRMVKTSYLWTASDPSYGAVNGDDLLPDLAIGRLPAANVDQARVMVEKIVAFETGSAGVRGRAVLVADNADSAGNFSAAANEAAERLSLTREVNKIYLGELGEAQTRSAIVDAFDDGASVMSYFGHGGLNLWASERVLHSSDVSAFTPQSQQPILFTMNCLNGYFHFPFFNSLSEELLKAERRGVIAAFSPSGLSLNGPAQQFHQALITALDDGAHERLGDAVMAAQAAYADTGALPELLLIYQLLGDPALNLR